LFRFQELKCRTKFHLLFIDIFIENVL